MIIDDRDYVRDLYLHTDPYSVRCCGTMYYVGGRVDMSGVPRDLTLNYRVASSVGLQDNYCRLVKFIENYKAKMIIFGDDRTPDVILRRCRVMDKRVEVTAEPIISLFFQIQLRIVPQ